MGLTLCSSSSSSSTEEQKRPSAHAETWRLRTCNMLAPALLCHKQLQLLSARTCWAGSTGICRTTCSITTNTPLYCH